MIGILVVSHEPLGTALIHCTRHIFGRMPPQLAALDVIPDEDPEAALSAARELIARINDGSGVLVLTDIFGATPSRIAHASGRAAPGRGDRGREPAAAGQGAEQSPRAGRGDARSC